MFLKNDEIDKKMAKSFSVANPAHMASVCQQKLFQGNTITSLYNLMQSDSKPDLPVALSVKNAS